ncbi:hypothetical protein JCM19232_1586 [Vibrio ishigakensis]|uniref:Acyloxyacyl hydrolase n=1 Tax=Vibrio ishigakensis TaxID=1481914 RepID=A0A0B8PTY1_9VIBR|nr:hypothetical protein JCM19232_1586 [Vibrio ishigakensis]
MKVGLRGVILIGYWAAHAFASASTIDLITLGRSEHYLNNEQEFNEQNTLFALGFEQDLFIGVYENSFNESPLLLGWQFGPFQHWNYHQVGLETSLLLGGVYGYKEADTGIDFPVLPYLLPTVSVTYSLSRRLALYYSYSLMPVPNGAISVQYVGASFSYSK